MEVVVRKIFLPYVFGNENRQEIVGFVFNHRMYLHRLEKRGFLLKKKTLLIPQ